MSRITVTDPNTTSKNQVIAVETEAEYQDLAEELSHNATVFNDQLRIMLPVDQFVTPDIEMHGKVRWKTSRFALDPYGSLEVKGNKIWTANPDFKDQYAAFFVPVTTPISPKQLARLSAEERAEYENKRALLEQDLQILRAELGAPPTATFAEIMDQYSEEDAFRNWVNYNFIAAEYAEYYLLQLGLTVGKLEGYTKFVGLATLLGNAAREGVLVGPDNIPAIEAGKTGDLLIEMYSKQKENDINQAKSFEHPFRQTAVTLDPTPLAWITYVANDSFGAPYAHNLGAVRELMTRLVETSQRGPVTNKDFLYAVSEAYGQPLEQMLQSRYLQFMYEEMSAEEQIALGHLMEDSDNTYPPSHVSE